MPFIGRQRFRNRGLALQRRFTRVHQSPWLLDYSEGTFTRASEAAFQDPRDNWRFQGSSESENWKGVNVPRIFDDGAILIEGARTNLMLRSEAFDVTASAWSNGATNASASAENLEAPDLGTDADLVYFQDATVNPQWHQTLNAASFTNNLTGSFTVWIQSTGSGVTEEVRLFSRAKDGSTLKHTPVTASNTWTVYTHTFGQHSGSIGPIVGIQNGESGGIKTFRAWGAQVEANTTFPSSYIRTEGAAATRALDTLSFSNANVPVQLKSGRFKIRFTFAHNGTDLTTAGHVYTLLCHGMNPLWIRSTGTNWQIWFQNSSGTSSITLGLGTSIDGVTNFDQWRFGDLCEIECDHVTGEVIWRNITRNKSASAAEANMNAKGGNWNTSTIYVGTYLGNQGAAFGVIERPRKA